MTANNFIREVIVKTLKELKETNSESFNTIIKRSCLTEEELFEQIKDDYIVAWLIGEHDLLDEYFVETLQEDDDGYEKVYLIEGRYVTETIEYGMDCYDKLDWRFVEKKTKMVEVTQWTEV